MLEGSVLNNEETDLWNQSYGLPADADGSPRRYKQTNRFGLFKFPPFFPLDGTRKAIGVDRLVFLFL